MFDRQRPRRSIVNALDRDRGFDRVVRNEQELRGAIDDAVRLGDALGGSSVQYSRAPFCIHIAGEIVVSDTIVIPSSVWGLELKGAPSANIRPGVTLDALFDVRGYHTRFTNLQALDLGEGNQAAAFIYVGDDIQGLVVDGVVSDMDALLVLDTDGGGLDYGLVSNCIHQGVGDLVDATQSLSYSRVLGNVNTSAGDITIDAGLYNVISGNVLSGANVTTSSSSGGNVIRNNANAGTITSHGSDSVGGNT